MAGGTNRRDGAALSLAVTSDPAPEALAAVSDGLSAFNAADVGPSGRLALAVLTHEGPDVVAGLSGYTAWGWLYVQWLWVHERLRGQGIAARLLGAAEAEARRRGCHGSYIDTFSPVALKVYRRCGYEPFGVLEDFPTGRTRTFLSKPL